MEGGTTTVRGKLLWAQSKVYQHPTTLLKDNVPGWIVLVKDQAGSIILAWLEEALIKDESLIASLIEAELATITLTKNEAPKEREAHITYDGSEHSFHYNIKALVKMHVRGPTLASWYGSIKLYERDTDVEARTLFFHDEESYTVSYLMGKDLKYGQSSMPTFPPPSRESLRSIQWGGETFLGKLRETQDIFRSVSEPSLFLINPAASERAAHSTAIYPDNALDLAPSYPHPFSLASLQSIGGPDSTAGMGILNAFSRVTIGARQAAASLLEMPLVKQKVIPTLPRKFVEPVVNTLQANIQFSEPVRQVTDEYNPARVYLATWAAMISDEAERTKRKQAKPTDDAHDVASALGMSTFELVNQDPAHKRAQGRTVKISKLEWQQWFDPDGRMLLSSNEAMSRIFAGSLHHEIRAEVWLFLLGIHTWDSTREERVKQVDILTKAYAEKKAKWKNSQEIQQSEHFQDQRHRIEKDVSRLDRSIAEFAAADFPNPDPNALNPMTNSTLEILKDILTTHCLNDTNSLGPKGYVQGMSDLIAPLWIIYQDEALTFLAYGNLMLKMDPNFREDQSGMRAQLIRLEQLVALMDPELHALFARANALHLFFAFRWILLLFKREMLRPVSTTLEAFEPVFVTWETIFAAGHLTKEYQLFVALAILEKNRNVLIDHLRDFDEILQFINGLAGSIDLEGVLIRAEELFWRFKVMLDTVRDQERNEAKSSSDLRHRKGTSTQKRAETQIELPVISPLLYDLC